MTLMGLWGGEPVKSERTKSVKRVSRAWTEKEDTFLIENYKDLRIKGLAKALNRTEKSIEGRANKLRDMGCKVEIQPQWSKEDTKFLKANYTKMRNQNIADCLGKTYPSVQSKLSYMGLRRNRSELV